MLKGQFIICDSNIPWHHNRYSKHHLMSRLARENDVVFVNPQVDAIKYGREHGWSQTRFGARFSYPEGEKLEVFQSLAVPRRGSAQALLKLDERFLCRQLRGIIRRHGGRPPILFIGNPWNVFLLDAFPDSPCTIYHCSDDFPALFGGSLGKQIAEREARLVPRVDLVLCSHPRLVEKCQRLGGSVHYLQHGVADSFLGCKHRGLAPPCDIAGLDRPIVGFTGSLDDGVDYQWLLSVIRGVPEANFVLVGPVSDSTRQSVEELAKHSNCHVLGPRPWETLPQYLAQFDVALIPLRNDAFNAGRSPLKLLEYLAAGLRVVSTTPVSDEELSPYVDVASNSEEATALIGRGPGEGTNHERAERCVETIRSSYTWTQRAEELGALIEDVLQGHSGRHQDKC